VRTRTMTLAAFAIFACSGFESSIAGESPQAQNASNPNASRPGAGAPNCAKLAETADKCVFHTRNGQIDIVRLPMTAGVTWLATASNPALVQISKGKIETLPEGSKQHVLQVVPRTPADADVVLKLEKHSSSDASAPASETRNINLMIHAITPASSN
jgi:hypothetical protein